jgi:hypothetical protein
MVLLLVLIYNVGFWMDGSLAVGSFDPVPTTFAFYTFYWLALYHYLTLVGSKALHVYRPLLDVDDRELARIDHELSSLPRKVGWLAVPLGIGLSAATVLSESESYGDLSPQTLVPLLVDLVATSFLSATFFGLIIRSIRQLRLVSQFHRRATNINLLDLEPSHAFSNLTARTGAGLILLIVVSSVQEPMSTESTFELLLTGSVVLLAIVIFILPLAGMQRHLEAEKKRALDEINDHLRLASERLRRKVKTEDYADIGGLNDAIEGLIRERELVEKVSTWPWDPRTVRGFASTLVLPIFLWVVTRLLERYL